MGWIDGELAIVALAAMLSPTTLSFSVLALVVSGRPFRTGGWFYLGALSAMLVIGVAAAFVIGDAAASPTSTPKTWVAVLDIVLAGLLLVWVARVWRRPVDPARIEDMVSRMGRVAESPWIAVVAAGATLANAGGFIPIALKDISELDPSTTEYVVAWVFFSIVSLLPLAVALVMLLVARAWTVRILESARDWLVKHAWTLAMAIVVLLAISLLRNGIAGLAG
jgi:Sap-like sulfolipid-1-addressing protein